MTVGNWERYSRHIASFITAVILTQPTLTTAVSHTTISHYQRPFPIVNPQSPLPITPHPANIRPMHTRHRWLIITLLGIAAVFRLYGLNNLSPPGLEHDEVAHWLINRTILDRSNPLARDPFLCALPL